MMTTADYHGTRIEINRSFTDKEIDFLTTFGIEIGEQASGGKFDI